MKWTKDRIVEWHKNTFPNATITSQIAKLDSEISELLQEAADVYIAALNAEERFGSTTAKMAREIILLIFGANVIFSEVEKKMEINSKRTFKGDHHVETIN